jgi:hypothetical protein
MMKSEPVSLLLRIPYSNIKQRLLNKRCQAVVEELLVAHGGGTLSKLGRGRRGVPATMEIVPGKVPASKHQHENCRDKWRS